MKKFLVIFLVIVAVLAVAVSAIIFVPKVVNESQVNKLASGGVKEGETAFVLSNNVEGSVKIENGKAEFCFTDVSDPSMYNEGTTSFVKEKEHLCLIGKYSVGADKNISMDVEECYTVFEVVGDEQNKAEYLATWSKTYKDYLDTGSYTLEDYNSQMARLNGEKCYSNEDSAITSAKIRMDTESGKVYLLSIENGQYRKEYSYYESGIIKSTTTKLMGLIPLHTEEYDTKGNRLKEKSKREFYDNGVIKKEEVKSSIGLDTPDVYEYDADGKLVKKSEGIHIQTYEYNDDGICINVKLYMTSGFGDAKLFKETQIIGYGHWIYTSTGFAGGIDDATKTTSVSEYYRGELLKETSYSYNDDGTQCLASKTEYKENGDYEAVSYFENGEKSSVAYFTKETDTLKTTHYDYYDNSKISFKTVNKGDKEIEYNSKDLKMHEKEYKYDEENDRSICTYYDTNGKKVQETITENGNVTKTYYQEDGSTAPYPTYNTFSTDDDGYGFERYRYDKNGKIVEITRYNEYGKLVESKQYNKYEYMTSWKCTYSDGHKAYHKYEYAVNENGEVTEVTLIDVSNNYEEGFLVDANGDLIYPGGGVWGRLESLHFTPLDTDMDGIIE